MKQIQFGRYRAGVRITLFVLAAIAVFSVALIRLNVERRQYEALTQRLHMQVLNGIWGQLNRLAVNPADREAAAAGMALCSLGGQDFSLLGRLFAVPERVGGVGFALLRNAAQRELSGNAGALYLCGKGLLYSLGQMDEAKAETAHTHIGCRMTMAQARERAELLLGDRIRLMHMAFSGDGFLFECRNCCLLLSRDGTVRYYAEQFSGDGSACPPDAGKIVLDFYETVSAIGSIKGMENAVYTGAADGVSYFVVQSVTTGERRCTIGIANDRGNVCYYCAQ